MVVKAKLRDVKAPLGERKVLSRPLTPAEMGAARRGANGEEETIPAALRRLNVEAAAEAGCLDPGNPKCACPACQAADASADDPIGTHLSTVTPAGIAAIEPPPEPANVEAPLPRKVESHPVAMPEDACCRATIEAGQLDDGRWAWGLEGVRWPPGRPDLAASRLRIPCRVRDGFFSTPHDAPRATREEAFAAAAAQVYAFARNTKWPESALESLAAECRKREAVIRLQAGLERLLPEQWGITIDDEFRDALRPLSKDELQRLRSDIIVRGCLDPLIVWRSGEIRILIDGHHRYQLCWEHRKPVAIVELEFASRAEALAWVDAHQIGRRNLDDATLAAMYRRELETRKAAAKNGARREPQGKAAEVVAKKTGTSAATVKRAAQSQGALEYVARSSGRSLRDLASLKRKEVLELASLGDGDIRHALAGGIDAWRLGKEIDKRATTSNPGKRDPRLNEHGVYTKGVQTVCVPIAKSHRCSIKFKLIQRRDGTWVYGYDWQHRKGGTSSPVTEKGRGFENRQTCLIAAAAALASYMSAKSLDGDWPAPVKKTIDAWRKTLGNPGPSKKEARQGARPKAERELRDEATRHIERYLDTIEPAEAARRQSDYLLDALNRWRSNHQGTKAPRRKR